MLKKTIAGSIFILLLSSMAFALQQSSEWLSFNSPEGRFSVVMPTKPKIEVSEVDSAVGTVTLYSYSSSSAVAFLTISYGDYPKAPADSANRESVLSGVRDGVIKGLGAELLSEEKVTVGSNPGRALTAKKIDKDTELVIHWRIYLVGRRVYQMAAITYKPNAESPDIAKFLKSFQLTN